MADLRSGYQSESPKSARLAVRYATAVIIAAAAILYTVQSLRGKIQRIDNATVALLVVTGVAVVLLITPGLTDRLSRVEVSGIKFEILRREQVRQQSELDEFSLIFPILLPETERRHLMNLAHHDTADYKGNHALRTELRRLRSIGLIRMLPKQHVSSIKDEETVDLGTLLQLTDLGQRWVRRIEETERSEARTAVAGPDSRVRSA
jgi:hypothetical protein